MILEASVADERGGADSEARRQQLGDGEEMEHLRSRKRRDQYANINTSHI